MRTKINWWRKTFTPSYLVTYHNDYSKMRTKIEVNFIIHKLSLDRQKQILDIGCGTGRHSIELSRLGYTVTALDQSSELLVQAKKVSRKIHTNVKFIQADMRHLPFSNETFDAIICMFTTLGYFSKQENQKVLQEMSRVLKPEGKILIDLYDYARVYEKYEAKRKIKKQNIVKITSDYLRGKLPIHDIQTFDLTSHIEHTKRYFTINGKSYNYELYITFYSLDQYKELLDMAGLEIVKIWGKFDGGPRSSNTTRTIMLIRKKAYIKNNKFSSKIKYLLRIFKWYCK